MKNDSGMLPVSKAGLFKRDLIINPKLTVSLGEVNKTENFP